MDVVQVEKAIKALGDEPTLKNFIEQFGFFAQAPSGMTQIKSLIYQLAIRGRLIQNAVHINAKIFLEELVKEKIFD